MQSGFVLQITQGLRLIPALLLFRVGFEVERKEVCVSEVKVLDLGGELVRVP